MSTESTESLRARLQALFGAELSIHRELGRGGMAAVFAAFDPALQRQVAIKILLPALADDANVADRFLREGPTMASLRHPNVVSVYAVRSGREAKAIVMEYIDGRSLEALMAESPRMALTDAGRILSEVAAGLQHAHDRDIVHRDVKPANVLIDRAGRAHVSDFGIARRSDGSNVTRAGIVLGTADFMSPEQRSGEQVTAAADQYALGVMAFELLTGRLPFVGDLAAVLRGHMVDAPPSMRTLRPEIPLAVDDLVQRMLAKSPEMRWPSLRPAEHVFASLDTAAFRTNPSGTTVVQLENYGIFVSAPTVPGARQESSAAVTPTETTSVGRRSRWMLGITAVALAVVAGAVVVTQREVRAPSAAPTAAARSGEASDVASTSAPSPSDATPRSSLASSSAPASSGPASAARALAAPASAATASAATARPVSVATTPAPSTRDGSANDAKTVDARPDASAPLSALNVISTAPAASASGLRAAQPSMAQPETPRAEPARAEPVRADATRADARRITNAFVTLLNQRRARDIAKLSAIGGDTAAREELLRLTSSAPDFAVGLDGMPSTPDEWLSGGATGVLTECLLDLEWRGGKRMMRATLHAVRDGDGWRLIGFGVDRAVP